MFMYTSSARRVNRADSVYLMFCLCFGLLQYSSAAAQSTEQDPGEEMLTGEELLENCRPAAGNTAPTSYCMEFVGGLVGTLAALQEISPDAEKIFCIDPQVVGLEEVTLKVTGWLEAHPERLPEPAFLLSSEALRDNYPCPGQGSESTRTESP